MHSSLVQHKGFRGLSHEPQSTPFLFNITHHFMWNVTSFPSEKWVPMAYDHPDSQARTTLERSQRLSAGFNWSQRPPVLHFRSSWIPLSRLPSSPMVMGVSHDLAFGGISPSEGSPSRIYYSRSASIYNSSEKDKRAFSTINEGRS